jgi:outer membrane protein TolC
MNKEEIEKMEIHAEEKEVSEKTEVTKPAGVVAKVALTKVPAAVNKTYIAKRLDAALKGAKPVNRSSDLVPLGREFDLMRKKLRLLIAAAKHYHAARAEVEKARMEVRTE